MSEAYTPTGGVGTAVRRATVAEAATGTHGDEFMRTNPTVIADKARYLTDVGQMQFPAAQVASANANTLDDYEEGTATCSLVPQTSGTITLSLSTLAYTKIGRCVTVSGLILVSGVAAPVGALRLTGLPFAAASGDSITAAGAISAEGLAAAATTALVALVGQGTAYATIQKYAAGATSNLAQDVQAGSEFRVLFTYFTA